MYRYFSGLGKGLCHRESLCKRERIGIGGIALEVIKSCLQDKDKQRSGTEHMFNYYVIN